MNRRCPSSDRPATFVVPHLADYPGAGRYLAETIEGITAQTDERWQVVIVDDASPLSSSLEILSRWQVERPDQIHVMRLRKRRGPGVCRNIGVQWAAEQKSPLVLFQDSDDIPHPDRLAVTRARLVSQAATCEFMYSPIVVIDENGVRLSSDALPPSTAEIVAAHRNPPIGPRAWVEIGIRTGYATVTSTVAVTTALAVRTPFPDVRFSEDSHTWLRMTAAGNGAYFEPSIPSLYRIPRDTATHRHRKRVGPDCNQQKLLVDTDGFLQALAIGLTNGSAEPGEVPELKRRFFERMAQTMVKEGENELAHQARLASHRNPAASWLDGATSSVWVS